MSVRSKLRDLDSGKNIRVEIPVPRVRSDSPILATGDAVFSGDEETVEEAHPNRGTSLSLGGLQFPRFQPVAFSP